MCDLDFRSFDRVLWYGRSFLPKTDEMADKCSFCDHVGKLIYVKKIDALLRGRLEKMKFREGVTSKKERKRVYFRALW